MSTNNNTVSLRTIVNSARLSLVESRDFSIVRKGKSMKFGWGNNVNKYANQVEVLSWEKNYNGEKIGQAKVKGVLSAALKIMGEKKLLGKGFVLNDTSIARFRQAANLGYCYGDVAKRIFPRICLPVAMSEEELFETIFRISWSGSKFEGTPIYYRKAIVKKGSPVANVSEQDKHDRNAVKLFEGMQLLQEAFFSNSRVKVAWSYEKYGYADYIGDMFALFIEGDKDALERKYKMGVQKGKFSAAMSVAFKKTYNNRSIKVDAIRTVTGNEITPDETLINKSVYLYERGATEAFGKLTFNENWKEQAFAIGNGRFLIAFAANAM